VARRRIAAADLTAHAEIAALRDASLSSAITGFPAATYVTIEPCAMRRRDPACARIRRRFRRPRSEDRACGSVIDLFAEPRLNHHATVTAARRRMRQLLSHSGARREG
jgi:tRNA(adenine34) deaminase